MYYHAGMAPEERTRAHRRWSNDELQVICATVAFGMGMFLHIACLFDRNCRY